MSIRKWGIVAAGMWFAVSGAVQAMMPEEIVYHQVSQFVGTPEAATIAEDIFEASSTYDVDPLLATAVFTTESHFDKTARSGCGAIGIAQLMPDTAASLQVNPYDRRDNIFGGVKYLRQMLDRYRTWDQPLLYAEAAYNAGPGAVDAARGVPRYAETQAYVQTVEQTRRELRRMAGYKDAQDYLYQRAMQDVRKEKKGKTFPSLQEWHDQQGGAGQNASLAKPSVRRP